MARRAKRVKLSRTQRLENELNHNLAKKDALLASLVKVMIKLKSLQRSHVRMQKVVVVRPEAPPVSSQPKEHPRVEAKQEKIANTLVATALSVPVEKRPEKQKHAKAFEEFINKPFIEARAKKMEALGFHKTKRRKTNTAAI